MRSTASRAYSAMVYGTSGLPDWPRPRWSNMSTSKFCANKLFARAGSARRSHRYPISTSPAPLAREPRNTHQCHSREQQPWFPLDVKTDNVSAGAYQAAHLSRKSWIKRRSSPEKLQSTVPQVLRIDGNHAPCRKQDCEDRALLTEPDTDHPGLVFGLGARYDPSAFRFRAARDDELLQLTEIPTEIQNEV